MPPARLLARRTVSSGITRSGGITSRGIVRGHVKVYGTKEAIAKLEKAKQTVYRDTGLVTFRSAEKVKEYAQEFVPKDTRALHDSIYVEKLGPYTYQVVASTFDATGREYAGYVEYGTSKMQAQPYMRPALNKAAPYAQAELTKLGLKVQRI